MEKKIFYEPERDVRHNLDCNRRELGTSILPHFHRAIEISVILEGEIDFAVGRVSRHVGPGDITFVPPYTLHSSSKSPHCEAAVLIVPHRYFADFEAELDGRSFSFLCDRAANRDIAAAVLSLCERLKQAPPPNDTLLRGYADTVLGLIADRYEAEAHDSRGSELVIDIIRYIDEHCTEPITLAALAAHFGYSKYHFSRLFHSTFHCSLPHYVNAVRLRRVAACDDTKKSEAILQGGFGSLSAFYRAKKK